MLWNCQKNNEINELYDVSVNKKLDYTLEKIGYSKLITDQEIKKALPKIKQRFSEGKKQNRQSKKTPQISENFTIITDSIHKIITKDVITWAFKIETPVLKNSDFENFLVKKYNEKFSYFLVSYKKDLETKYKKATLYLISKESLNLDNLNLARKGDYLMDDNTNGGGGPCEGDIYTEIKSCDKGGYHTAKYCCQHYGGIHGCSNSKPCDYTCTGTDVVTIIDFTNCFNGGSLGPDNIPDYNPSDNDNTQNGDSGMSNSGGSTSSNGGTVITSPVTLECDNCSNSQSLISYLNLTDQTQIDWVNDANNNNIITELSSFIAFNNNSDEAINFAIQAINALIEGVIVDSGISDFVDKEPVKDFMGVVSDFKILLDNSPRGVGRFKGTKAGDYLKSLGETKFNFKQMRPLPTQTGLFNSKKGRYIYTKKGGWIDMAHFLFYAGKAYKYKIAGKANPIGEAVQDGYRQELSDLLVAKHSAYSYEDLPSDKFGAEFAVNYFNSNSSLTFSEQLANYLNNILKAAMPLDAPNYNNTPNNDSRNAPTEINKTTNPIYTQ